MEGRHGRAARLCAAAAALRARVALEEPAFDAEWAAGFALTLETAADAALAADERIQAGGA